jgi:hypothetical protein
MDASITLPKITPPPFTASLGTAASPTLGTPTPTTDAWQASDHLALNSDLRTAAAAPLAVPSFVTAPPRTPDHLALKIAARTAAAGISSVASYQLAKQAFPGQPDKAKHAFVSAAIASGVSAATEKPLLGLAASVGVGIVKELIDGSRLNPGGSRDFKLNGDLGADLMGAALGSLAISVTIPLERRITRRSGD